MPTLDPNATVKQAASVSSKFLAVAAKLPPLLLSTILFEFLLFWIVIVAIFTHSAPLGYGGTIAMVITFMVITILHMGSGSPPDHPLHEGHKIRANLILGGGPQA